ncbi:MAG: hypothetical protein ACSHW4_13905 [Cellulophaga sp.]|uniref:hypothetical protein n=1 Tax=unclassified Cellulophaga TaxID=2634405 RepID=UPI0026E36524|nr:MULTISPECIES: hypothetical protein [unclassified Cellulophaga]MDO6492123.1 hypothetical protein [Cellulophaga sp. 2_MG-2023]MDO6495716.1 hypothetical protein [Cellulophaga sp. 3_MG-2023]
MFKFWKQENAKYNKLILIKDSCIFIGNPNDKDISKLNSETTDFSFLKAIFSIPYSYIKKIETQEGKNKISIYYGKESEEEIVIKDEKIKKEVFSYLKSDIHNAEYKSKKPNVFIYAKSQMFAVLIVSLIFGYSFYSAHIIENQLSDYIYVPNIILLPIIDMGTTKIAIVFAALITVCLFALVHKLKSISKIESIIPFKSFNNYIEKNI